MPLHHATDEAPGLGRKARGHKRFLYIDAAGKPVRDTDTLARIRALAIPPAWTKVWISPDPDSHLQATGRDARGRKQYRYHAKWRAVRDEAKYHRLVQFCAALPKLRAAVERDLACACLCKAKVVATVVALMERAQLRVGNDEYARTNGSYGATTLLDRHAKFHGGTLELAYRGKSGVQRRVTISDRRLARIVRSCRDLPGQRLFQYLEGDDIKHITSGDVNEYLRDVAGDDFSAKDYRTWAATCGAALLLSGLEAPASARAGKKAMTEVLCTVAAQLGHTPTVCRQSYIHPRILEDYGAGRLSSLGRALARCTKSLREGTGPLDVACLRAVERHVARYLDGRARRRA